MRREVAQNLGKIAEPDPQGAEGKDRPPPEKASGRVGASRERMIEITRIRQEKIARGELTPTGGRPKTKFKPQEVIDAVLDELMPEALKVLKEQLQSPDEKIRQAAAVKVIEYKMGKPTQQVKAEIDQRIASIRFETQALLPLPPGVGEILSLDGGADDDDEPDDGAAG